MSSFLSALAAASSRGPEPRASSPSMSLDQCIGELTARACRSTSPCPFKVGDIVTVRTGTDIRGGGEPHVVVEVLDTPFVDTRAEAGSNRFLARYTMRVVHFVGDSMTMHAVDCSAFEVWTPAHAAAYEERRAEAEEKRTKSRRVKPDTPLSEIVWLLRGESKRLADAKITWKKGDLVEITGYETSRATRPMLFEGKAIGVVERVDHTDDTTRVIYFDHDGDRCTQWFKPADLKPHMAADTATGAP